MYIKTVTKRDGTTEEFKPEKILQWNLWACHDIKEYIDWQSIVIKVAQELTEGISTQAIQLLLSDECNNRKTWFHSIVAGRLYTAYITKKIFPNSYLTLKEQHIKMLELGLMVDLGYTDEEYSEIQKVIDHSKDYELSYLQIKQLTGKYSLSNKTTKQVYETPQYVYARMAMALVVDETDRVTKAKKFYKYFSENKINAPTPNYVNLGTKHKGFISCCLYTSGDSASSLAIGDHIAYTMTYMSAGIGGFINSRSMGDEVKSGIIRHMGKLPYFKSVGSAVNANMQTSRGGACTQYFSCFDPEVIDIIHLQNPRTPISKQNRDLHFAMQYNKLFVEKVHKNDKVFLFNIHTAPKLVEAFFSGDPDFFKQVYEVYENDVNFTKTYMNAKDIAIAALRQAHEVATLYFANIDEINHHTSFKDEIYSSNLCVAGYTPVLTKEFGYRNISDMVNTDVNVWNGKEWSPTTIKQTGINKRLLTVTMSTGAVLDVTAFHKWHIKTFDGRIIIKRTSQLEPDDELIPFDLPLVPHGDKVLPRAYLEGALATLPSTIEKNIPSIEYTIKTRLLWLSGALESMGMITGTDKHKSICLVSDDYEFLTNLKLMLQELGCDSYLNTPFLLNTKILHKHSKIISKIVIPNNSIYKLLSMGLDIIQLSKSTFNLNKDKIVNKVISVSDRNLRGDTYCFTERKRNLGMFAGVLAGNCVEITQPTKPYNNMQDLYSTEPNETSGEISLCGLGGIIHSNIDSDEECEDVAYYTLLMIDKCIHNNLYIFPHLEYTAKARLNAGVGIIGLAYELARKGLKYNTEDGLKYMHEIAERHSYFLIKASLKLGKEKGNAAWIDKTKWPDGWLPIDTYNRNVDKIADFKLKYDWELLRTEVIENKGIRNSSLVALMPTESSSKATGLPNCIYPVRDIYLKKTDGSNAIDYVVKESDILEKSYQFAWELSTEDICKVYGVFQKFTDQSISADFYSDRTKDTVIRASKILSELFYMYKYGIKTRYYTNSKTTKGHNLKNIEPDSQNVVGTPTVDTGYESSNSVGCEGGFCTL